MTLAIGITTKDRIVIVADGKVQDTEKGILNKEKVFQLSSNCGATLAGMQLKSIDEFVKTLQFNVKDQNIIGVKAIAEHIMNFATQRTWAEYDDIKKSHLVMLIAGYDNNEPQLYVLLSTGELSLIDLKRYATGNWDKAIDYLFNALGQKTHGKISSKTAERVAVEMLAEGEEANSKDIGGQGMLWHIRPHKIEKKSPAYLAKLQQKHLKKDNM